MYSVVTSMKRAPDFDQPPREQAAEAEAADHLLSYFAEPILLGVEPARVVAGHVLRTCSSGSSDRSNAFAAGELSRRCALSSERSSDSF